MDAVTLTHGALFAGIGGFDLGFERVGIKTIWQVELNDYSRKVLARHFPDAERFYSVTTAGDHDWKLLKVDIISGGFPCQDISTSGKGAGIDGKRSGLWKHYARIIGELRPRYVVVENVAALLDRGMGRVLGDLAALGYDAEWRVFTACEFGAPHTRPRVFIVAYPTENRRRHVFFDRENSAEQGDVRGTSSAGDINSYRKIWETLPSAGFWPSSNGVPVGLAKQWAAVGNAIVPQIAEYIGHRIVQIESENNA